MRAGAVGEQFEVAAGERFEVAVVGECGWEAGELELGVAQLDSEAGEFAQEVEVWGGQKPGW